MKKFISFSGGVESSTMCLLYGKGATAIVCDTGDEEPEMYERWDLIESMMKVHHNGDFELIRIKPNSIVKGVYYDNLDDYVIAKGVFPSSGMRYCTARFKIEPIDNYLRNQGNCELMIGLNADEEDSREGNWEALENVNYTYPLVEDGFSRIDCINELDKYGIAPNFPPYMKRGGCRKCFFRGKKEAKAKYFFNKEGFLEDMAFEIKLNEQGTRRLNKSGTSKKFFGINQAFPLGYKSIAYECEQEIAMYGLEQMKSFYTNVGDHKTCGVFCHR
jgi:hypothetical protein